MGKLKVTVDRNICIGASTCVAIASKTFELDTEAKAVILNSAGQDPEEIVLNAAKVCPVAAITIENEKGEKVYPK
ncbi:MAG: ferredoxin [Candidatus Roizmanbacteria bacterium]|nr:MAG: ferredoxin [Candidatus Roizmanbacteria bacterium]